MTSQEPPLTDNLVIPGRYDCPKFLTPTHKKNYKDGPAIPGPLMREDAKGILHALGTVGYPYRGIQKFSEEIDGDFTVLENSMACLFDMVARENIVGTDPDALEEERVRWKSGVGVGSGSGTGSGAGSETIRTDYVQPPRKKGQVTPDPPVLALTKLVNVYGHWMSVKSSHTPAGLGKIEDDMERFQSTLGSFVTWSKEHMEGGNTVDSPALFVVGHLIPLFNLVLFMGHVDEHVRRWRAICIALMDMFQSGQMTEIPFSFGLKPAALVEMVKADNAKKFETALAKKVQERREERAAQEDGGEPDEDMAEEDYFTKDELYGMTASGTKKKIMVYLKKKMEKMFEQVTVALPGILKEALKGMKEVWKDPKCLAEVEARIGKLRMGREPPSDLADMEMDREGEDGSSEDVAEGIINDGDDLGTLGPPDPIGGLLEGEEEEESGSSSGSNSDGVSSSSEDSSDDSSAEKSSKKKAQKKKKKDAKKSKKIDDYDDVSGSSQSEEAVAATTASKTKTKAKGGAVGATAAASVTSTTAGKGRGKKRGK